MTSRPSEESDQQGPRDRFVMGIDLGGTSIKLGLLRNDQLIARTQISTANCDEPADAFREARAFVTSELVALGHDFESLQAVGLAMAGVIDEESATLMETANLHSWHGIGFHRELAEVFQKPVAVINDANAAALGESSFGRHQSKSLAFLTLGTGIGGGIIVGGRPINGSHGCGGEIGHVTIDHSDTARRCGCGKLGHLEAYAGASGIVQTAQECLSRSSRPSSLSGHAELTPAAIAAEAEKGDIAALETVRQTAVYLGRAIAMLTQIADPSVVLLGGAVNFGGHQTKTGKQFLETIREETVGLSLVQVGSALQIDFASLGNDAGMLGAARHARQVAL